MSENKHTPEPWRIGRLTHPRDYESVRETVGPHEVVVDTDEGVYVLAGCNYNFPQDALANARRIVACVNACAGIPIDMLEAMPSGPAALLPMYARLEKQRDDLLAALEGLTSDIQSLIGESCGVSGLHMNGDIASWDELESGGRFERLTHLPCAHAAIASVKELK